MKLINCPACQKEISAAARACPGCGHPVKLESSRDNFAGKIILVVFLVIGAIWLLITTVSQVN